MSNNKSDASLRKHTKLNIELFYPSPTMGKKDQRPREKEVETGALD